MEFIYGAVFYTFLYVFQMRWNLLYETETLHSLKFYDISKFCQMLGKLLLYFYEFKDYEIKKKYFIWNVKAHFSIPKYNSV